MDLSGRWRAMLADDEVRRTGLGLEHDDTGWPEIDVPGHWQSTPAFATADGPLLYRRRFHLDEPVDGQRHFVELEGIFYQADVWLDGAYLGDPEGYFSPHTFDVTDLARLGTEHVLAVEVSCAGGQHGGGKRNITGAFQDSDSTDPAWNPGGLWRPVHVLTTGPVRIDRLRVLCRDVNEARAHLRLHARLDADEPRTARVITAVGGRTLSDHERPLAKGWNEVDWNIDIDQPRLWWPWSLGTQDLVDVEVEVRIDGVRSHATTVRTGLREVSFDDWVMSVNGERMFTKGANLAPTRLDLAAASATELRRDIELARETGLDLVRLVAHLSRPDLYNAADELGVLIWQDFPLQWTYARSIRKEAVRQAREVVDLFGHHPSIAVWCAHNEPMRVDAGRATAMGTSVVGHIASQQLPTWNKSVLDRWVRRAFERADETRRAIAHSGVPPHLPQLDGTDSHLFFGWYHGTADDLAGFAAAVPRMVRFVSDFGTQSVPPTADFIDVSSWPAIDWARLVKRYGLQLEVMEIHVPSAEHETFESWREATQLHQATVLRHQIEVLRRLKYRPTGGFCFSALNDAAPAISWGVVDHARRPKLAHQAVVDACRPVIVVADQMPDTMSAGEPCALDVHVVSDLRRALEAVRCTAALRWPGGGHEWTWRGDVPADACVRVGTVRFVVPEVDGELWLDLTVEHGDEVATNRSTATITRSAAR